MPTCFTCGAFTSIDSFSCVECQQLKVLDNINDEIDSFGDDMQQDFRLLGMAQLVAYQNMNQNLRESNKAAEKINSNIKKGFAQLGQAIHWGVNQIKWEMEQNRDVLKSIDETLKTPSETQANEWHQMADKLANRGVLDEAEEFYRKSLDKNRLDYRVYISLSDVLLKVGNFDESYKILEKSLPHAPDAYYRSYALRIQARIMTTRNEYHEADKLLEEAVALSPEYGEAVYDLAQCKAALEKPNECTPFLEKAISKNAIYWYLPQNDPSFRKCWSSVKKTLQETGAAEKKECKLLVMEAGVKLAIINRDRNLLEQNTDEMLLTIENHSSDFNVLPDFQSIKSEVMEFINAIKILEKHIEDTNINGVNDFRKIVELNAELQKTISELKEIERRLSLMKIELNTLDKKFTDEVNQKAAEVALKRTLVENHKKDMIFVFKFIFIISILAILFFGLLLWFF